MLTKGREGLLKLDWVSLSVIRAYRRFHNLNSVSMFSLFSQLKKLTQAAEQPISFEYFQSRDIFSALIGYSVLPRT